METSQPHITTMPVEIKALRVNNQKMTLSVFDQLPEISFDKVYKNGKYTDEYEKWGIVKRKDKETGFDNWLIVNVIGKLYKCNLSQVYRAIRKAYINPWHKPNQIKGPRDIPPSQRTQECKEDVAKLRYIDSTLDELHQLFIAT